MSSGASSWREILNPTKPLTKLTKGVFEEPSVSIVGPSVGNKISEAVPDLVPDSQDNADKTDKRLTAAQSYALRLLNLAGCRIICREAELVVGVWVQSSVHRNRGHGITTRKPLKALVGGDGIEPSTSCL